MGDSPLSTQFLPIFRTVRKTNSRVQKCYGTNRWKWRKISLGFTPCSQSEEDLLRDFKCVLDGFNLTDGRDGIKWRWTQSEVFLVKSMYLFLQDSGVIDERFAHLWKLNLPLKVKIFVWLVLRRRMLTADLLLKRGWNGNGNCALCLGANETADHLFAGCAFTNSLLESLVLRKAAVRTSTGVSQLWGVSERHSGALSRSELSSIAATWWFVWLERNRRRFDDKRRGPGILQGEIRGQLELWSSFCR